MAPRWLSPRQASWGTPASNRSYTLKSVAFIGFFLLVLGAATGFALAGGSNSDAAPRSGGSQTGETPVVAQDVALVGNADFSESGAVKAATGFIAGLPNLGVVAVNQQDDVLDQVLAPTAPAEFRQKLLTDLAAVNQSLRSNASQRRVSVVTTPASYRAEFSQETKAARVTVWYLTVTLDSSNQTVRSEWATGTVGMAWTDHWRITGFDTRSGPSPQIFAQDAQFSSYEQVANVFNGFKAYGYAPTE